MIYIKGQKNRAIKKIKSNSTLANLLIAVLLLIFWAFASLIFYHRVSFSVLTYVDNIRNIKFSDTATLLKGDKVGGEFQSNDNFLGIVMLRFDRFIKPDFAGEDVLIFRIKEKNQKGWYYVNTYKSGLLEHQLLFPFGFPRIDDARDKVYEFEIESTQGTARNAITIDNSAQSIITGHQYPRIEITGSRRRMVSFFGKKIYSSFNDIDFILNSTLYLLPLLFFLLWKLFFKRNKLVKIFLSKTFVLFILIDIFLIKELYLGILIMLILGWLFSCVVYKFESSSSFLFAFFIIAIWIILLQLNVNGDYTKLNLWVYIFLVFGLFQAVKELKFGYKKSLDYKMFLKSLITIK